MSEHPPNIIEELELIFAWNPIAHIYGSRHAANNTADPGVLRQAMFYDMHLAPSRICKKVVHVPNLHRRVTRVVDEKLQGVRDNGVSMESSTSPGFTNQAQRDRILRPMVNPLRNQQAVVEYYNKITSVFCIPVASSLALHPTIWSRVLTWSSIPQHNTLANYGGSLQLLDISNAETYLGPHAMAPEMLEKLKQVKAKYEDLATWDVSSLSLEDTNAMLGVLVTASSTGDGEFRWKSCSGPACVFPEDSISKMQSSTPTHDSPEFASLATVPRPSDGASRPIDSPESILDDSLRRGGSSFQALREDISVKEAESATESVAGSETGSEAEQLSARSIEKTPWTPPGGGHAASQQLIQRAWAQSVRQNSTVLIMHGGNYEYICLRHRETQTLYISDILHIPFLKDPGYGKVQIGIYIIALEDALQRMALDSAFELADGYDTHPSSDVAGRKAVINSRKGSVKKRSGGAIRGRLKKRQRTIDNPEWCIQQAISRNFLLVHFCYDIYETPNSEVFHRAPVADSEDEDTPEPPPPAPVLTKDARLLLFLNSELGQGNTGVVHGGILEVEVEDARSRLDVAAKFSFSDEQRERLHEEWSVHMYLTSQGVKGIPTLLGIFYDPEVEKAPLCLLTCHAGVSLQKSGKSITSAQRDTFLAVLMAIHLAGVHHGDLRYENLLINDSGKVTIIDLDRATLNASESAREEEYRKLCSLLETKVDDSTHEDLDPEGKSSTRIRKERDSIGVQNPGRVTRSMGTARQTLGGMTLRPRR